MSIEPLETTARLWKYLGIEDDGAAATSVSPLRARKVAAVGVRMLCRKGSATGRSSDMIARICGDVYREADVYIAISTSMLKSSQCMKRLGHMPFPALPLSVGR